MSVFLISGCWVILVIASITDIRKQEVKDGYWIAIVVMAVVRICLKTDISLGAHLLGAFSFSSVMLLLSVVKEGAFGGGDIKLMFACGLFSGAKTMLVATVIAILLAGFFVIVRGMLMSRTWRDHVPLVPFICGGMVIGMLFSQQMIDWYLAPLL